MSYQYVRAVGVALTGHAGEAVVDLSTLKTNQYFKTYSKLRIVILDELVGKQLCLNAFDYQYEFQTFDGTIEAWLLTKENDPLTLSSELPGEKLVYVQRGDAQLSGYRIAPANHLLSADRQALVSVSEAPDLLLTTIVTTRKYDDLITKCLFNLNGHFIRGISRDDGIYLLNGGKNYRINDSSHVDIYDFSKVSTLETRPFTEDMIKFIDEDGFTGLEVELDVPIKDKKVWLIIAGRLVTGSPLVTRTGEKRLRIDYRHYKWPERIFESLNYIDLGNLYPKERKVIAKDKLYTAETFKALLLNQNSFFVVFDNPDFGITITPLITYRYPTVFLVNDTYAHPLMLSNGLFPSYISKRGGNQMLWSTDIRLTPDYVNGLTGVDNGGDLYHAFRNRYFSDDLVTGFVFKIHALV